MASEGLRKVGGPGGQRYVHTGGGSRSSGRGRARRSRTARWEALVGRLVGEVGARWELAPAEVAPRLGTDVRKNGLRAVFFDAGGVLLYVPQLWPARMAAALQEFGHAVSPEEVSEARAGVQLPPWPKTLEEEAQFWPLVYSATLSRLEIPEPRPPHEEIHNKVWWVHYARLFDDAIPTLDQVRNLGLPLGLISNASPSMEIVLGRLGIKSYFETVVISDMLGILKPDPRIFEHALCAMGVAAAEAVFIDDIPENVNAARNLGMTALLLDREGQYTDPATPVIRSLREVVEIIQRE